MNKAEHNKQIFSGKYILPLDTATKKSYKIVLYRSTIESGRIKNITIPSIPDNCRILSSKDLKKGKFLNINDVKIPILAVNEVKYIGEPILLLIGPNMQKLYDIHKKIVVEYLPTKLQEKILYKKELEIGIVPIELNEKYKIISGQVSSPNRNNNNKLISGAFAKRDTENLIINTSVVLKSQLKDSIKSVCNIDEDKIIINTPSITGEEEPSIYDNTISSLHVAIAATTIKRNVLYTPTPEDFFLFSSKVYGIHADWKIILDENRRLLGLHINVKINCGAYPLFIEEKVLRIIHGLISYYRFRNIKIVVNAINSNAPIGAIGNSLYLADALYISEYIVSTLIMELGEDQYNWRNNNLLLKGYKNSSETIIKNDIPLSSLLKNIVNQSDFSRKNSSINLSLNRKNRRVKSFAKKGIGIALGYNGNSFISNKKELLYNSVSIVLNRNGSAKLSIDANISNLDLLNYWEDIVFQTLNITKDKIIVSSSQSKDLGAPNIENKNVSILTNLIKQCAEEVKERRFRDPLPIKQTKVTRKKSINVWNPNKWRGTPFKNSSYACCAVEVEIDKRSLDCIIKEIWLQVEVGKIINKSLLLRSIKKEIHTTILWLQGNEPTFSNGKFHSEDFYNKNRIVSKPKLNISILNESKKKNIPKGSGSLVRNTLPGAYIQGINQALDARIDRFPVNREMIYKEIIKNEI